MTTNADKNMLRTTANSARTVSKRLARTLQKKAFNKAIKRGTSANTEYEKLKEHASLQRIMPNEE